MHSVFFCLFVFVFLLCIPVLFLKDFDLLTLIVFFVLFLFFFNQGEVKPQFVLTVLRDRKQKTVFSESQESSGWLCKTNNQLWR